MKKIYIAGKITGCEAYKTKFFWCAARFDSNEYIVLNPAELPASMTNSDYMRICFSMIDSADVVYFMKDWKDSKGATLEHQYCEYIGKEILYEE